MRYHCERQLQIFWCVVAVVGVSSLASTWEQEPPGSKKKLAVVLVTCARGIYTPLRPAVPPLTAQRSFACSVASLSQYPRHYLPGHCGLHHIDPAGCHLGWDRPSTWRAAHDTVPSTPANHPPPGSQDAVTHLGCQTSPGGCSGPVLHSPKSVKFVAPACVLDDSYPLGATRGLWRPLPRSPAGPPPPF